MEKLQSAYIRVSNMLRPLPEREREIVDQLEDITCADTQIVIISHSPDHEIWLEWKGDGRWVATWRFIRGHEVDVWTIEDNGQNASPVLAYRMIRFAVYRELGGSYV